MALVKDLDDGVVHTDDQNQRYSECVYVVDTGGNEPGACVELVVDKQLAAKNILAVSAG